MKHQYVTSDSPTRERPPRDPKNDSPASGGTARGAKSDQQGSNNAFENKPDGGTAQASIAITFSPPPAPELVLPLVELAKARDATARERLSGDANFVFGKTRGRRYR